MGRASPWLRGRASPSRPGLGVSADPARGVQAAATVQAAEGGSLSLRLEHATLVTQSQIFAVWYVVCGERERFFEFSECARRARTNEQRRKLGAGGARCGRCKKRMDGMLELYSMPKTYSIYRLRRKGDSQLGRIGVQSGFILREGRALRWSEAA